MENPPPAPVRPPGEPVKTVEPLKSSEKELFNSHFRALHGRILLGGDNLNPDNKSISPVTKEALSVGSPQLLNECATNCRKKVATVEKDQLEGEINSRVAKNTLVLKQDLSKIESFDQEKATRWQATLTKLFGKDTASATEAEVRTLFDKYFYSKDKLGNDSDTNLFSEDVLKVFDGDLTALEENADCIIWYARVCGFTQDYSETVFKHQITAKALQNSNPDQLVTELNQKEAENQSSRINNPNGDEEEVLKFIWGNKGKIEFIPDKTEPPTKPDETEPTPKTDVEVKKEDYLIAKKNGVEFITDSSTTIEILNKRLETLGLEKLTEDQFKQIKENEEERSKMARKLVIASTKIYFDADITNKVAIDEIRKLPEEEQQAITLNYQVKQIEVADDKSGLKEVQEKLAKFQKEHDIDLEKLMDNINKAIKIKEPSIKEEVDRQIQAFEKNIDTWEETVPAEEGSESESEPEIEPDEATEQKPFESGKDYTLEEIFSSIHGSVDKKHRFFVENPPTELKLSHQEMDRLRSTEPFIVDITRDDSGRVGYNVNREVVPFVFEIGDGGDHPDQRFLNGEAATDGDSGLVGLAAASASTPEQQAILYRDFVNAIVDIHDRDHSLRERWLEAQSNINKDGLSPFYLLSRNDLIDQNTLKPEQERLFLFSQIAAIPDRKVREEFSSTWRHRIPELRKALHDNKLQKHHLRWIELLAHSVDVDGLMGIIKENAPTPSGEEEKKKPSFARKLLDEYKARIADRQKNELPS